MDDVAPRPPEVPMPGRLNPGGVVDWADLFTGWMRLHPQSPPTPPQLQVTLSAPQCAAPRPLQLPALLALRGALLLHIRKKRRKLEL